FLIFFFQAEDGIRDRNVTGVQTCALPILLFTVKSAVESSKAKSSSEISIAFDTYILFNSSSATSIAWWLSLDSSLSVVNVALIGNSSESIVSTLLESGSIIFVSSNDVMTSVTTSLSSSVASIVRTVFSSSLSNKFKILSKFIPANTNRISNSVVIIKDFDLTFCVYVDSNVTKNLFIALTHFTYKYFV